MTSPTTSPLARLAASARIALPVLGLALLGACATASGPAADVAPGIARAAQPLDYPDQVVWVRLPATEAGARVELTGAPVAVVAGARAQEGDTLFASAPFAVAVPAGAFELGIDVHASPRSGNVAAQVEFATVGAGGELEMVRASGAHLTLRRADAGQPLVLSGAPRVVQSVALAGAAGR